mgnify:CR=1 FL=1
MVPRKQAGHMTCTRPQAARQILLAMRASSTHDPIRTSCADPLTLSLRGTEAWLAGRGPSSETSARGDGLTKRSLGCACRAFQSHHSSTPTGCRCRILIREHIAVDRDETLLVRIVPRGKAAADNM